MEKMKAYLKIIDQVIEKGPIKDNWESLKDHKVPDWYRQGKFGIFIHWGAYSVPAFDNEWYPRNMYQKESAVYEHHLKTYGPHKAFGYKDFIPQFEARKFDAAEWADLFQKSGARFVMPVAEHHDGFQMYHSELSDWCASKMGPKKDIVGLLGGELAKRNLVLAASSHRVEHYWFLDGGKEFDSDLPAEVPYGHLYWPSNKRPQQYQESIFVEAPGIDPLFMEDWLARTCELVDRYRPKLVFFDWWIQVEPMKPYLKKFAAYYYNRALEWGEEVTINYKYDAFQYGTAVQDIERGQMANAAPFFWQNDTSVAKNSWCYTEGNDYKKPAEILADLVDVVSKNGALLLNIGPKADGTIPQADRDILLAVGKWLAVNGEGIYGTSPWKRSSEGPTQTLEGAFTDTLRQPFTSEDFRFTYKDGFLYVFALQWPDDGVVRIKTLARDSRLCTAVLKSVQVLGAKGPVRTVRGSGYLSVTAEVDQPVGPVCIKIGLE